MAKTKLEYLNDLLRRDAAKLNLPQFRAQVTDSGGNQDWLLKAMKRHDDADQEIVALLQLPFKKLLVPHEPAAGVKIGTLTGVDLVTDGK